MQLLDCQYAALRISVYSRECICKAVYKVDKVQSLKVARPSKEGILFDSQWESGVGSQKENKNGSFSHCSLQVGLPAHVLTAPSDCFPIRFTVKWGDSFSLPTLLDGWDEQ